MTIFERLTISRRLLMIAAAFTLPIGVMLSLIVITINRDIAFSALELDGNRYQRPLEALLGALSDSSTTGGPAAAGRVDAAFAALEAVDARLGARLQFTTEGLAQRQRNHVRVANVRQEWIDLKASLERTPASAAAERHRHLMADVRTMITHVGDTSNLILDPDLDSYYTMDMTLVALPQSQDRTTALITLAGQLAARPVLNEQERVQLAVAAAFIRDSDRDRIVGAAGTALNEDKNFHGTSDSLQRNLPPAVKSYEASASALIAALGSAAASSDPAGLAAVAAAATRARAASFSLWNTAADELDVLLEARLRQKRWTRLWAVALSVLAWAGALAIVFVIARSIAGPLIATSAELAASAHGLVTAASQVAASSQSLSQAASEQAATLEETSASMEEMSSMTRQNAASSRAAAGLVDEVSAQVTESNAALDGLVSAMASIRESSHHVARIIKTIDAIAFQTNILALNAAVEAARAGDAGLGFAVVADEVRSLAQRSAHAARDTARLIETSLAKARTGNDKVAQVAAAITSITGSVVKVKGLVDEVSAASRQQAQGIDQVAQSLALMDRLTQTTAATAGETAAASDELNARADASMGVVARLEALVGGASQAAPSAQTEDSWPDEHAAGNPASRRAGRRAA